MLIDIQKDGSEKVKYDYDGYYAYIRRALLSRYPDYSADSHWHDDLEFIQVLSGSMKYNVNGEIVKMEAGNGILVNTRQLHYGFSDTKEECEFLCVLLHPVLLCTAQSLDRDYVSPILSDDTLPSVLLQQQVEWQQGILTEIRNIYECRNAASAPLAIQAAFYRIWTLLYENTAGIRRIPKKEDRQLFVLKDMIAFIQENYSEHVSLGDIAAAGNVSKSTCLSLFKKYLKDTPTSFLISFRLKKAASLLAETDHSVSEIALSVGFSGISYFSETFRQKFGCTPREYRGNNC